MPLLKRFETELVPEWRKQCIDYKGLKKRAESLVGSEKAGDLQEKEQEEFQQFFSHEMEKISHLYTKQERKLCKFFCAMEGKVEGLLASIEANRKDYVDEDGSPNPDAIFEDATHKQVPVAMLAFMVHIDALRSFALLNTLAVLHISQRHCSKLLGSLVLHRLYQEPFYSCNRMTTLVEEITRISNKFLEGSVGSARKQHSDGFEEEEPARRSSEGDAMDYLSAYCTWVNMRGRVPPWVCKSLANTSLLQGDRRSIRVSLLMQDFVAQLSTRLQSRGLAHMVPALVKQMSVVKPQQAKPQQQTPQAHQQRTPAVAAAPRRQAEHNSGNCAPKPSTPMNIPQRAVTSASNQDSPIGPHPVRVNVGQEQRQQSSMGGGAFVAGQQQPGQGKGVYTFATLSKMSQQQQQQQRPSQQQSSGQAHVNTNQGGARPAAQGAGAGKEAGEKSVLRLTRSCWDLQALTLCSPSVTEGLSLLCSSTTSESGDSALSSAMHSPTSSRSSSPPMGASPPGCSSLGGPSLERASQRRSGDNLRIPNLVIPRIAPTQSEVLEHVGRNESVMTSAERLPARGCKEALGIRTGPGLDAGVECDS